MTTDNQTTTEQTNKPVYRLSFAPYDGVDKSGQKVLSYPVEIGAAFNRTQKDKGLILKLKIIPANLDEGVLFLMPPLPPKQAQSENEELPV